MDSVVRAAVVYLFLLLVFRIVGRRTFADMTSFDFVLLVLIGEATQQALLGSDISITNAVLAVATLVLLDVGLSIAKARSRRFAHIVDGTALIVVEDGRPLPDRLRRARIDIEDVMKAARKLQGLERMDQIRYAILEASGGITVIPQEPR